MTRTAKTILWVIIALIVLYIGWMLINKSPDDTTTVPAYDTTSQVTPDQSTSATQNADGSTVSSASDTSDSSINNDTASIDAQMKGLDSDSTASAAGSDTQ